MQTDSFTDEYLSGQAQSLALSLSRANLSLATAESCTGGWLAKLATDIAGSSAWFERGFVTYTNISKQEMLGVPAATIENHGAVSEATVRAMAHGALEHSHADISVAISGIAGPGGATPGKPVGTVWFAWGERRTGDDLQVDCMRYQFDGDRDQVRRQAVSHAMHQVLQLVSQRQLEA